MNSNRWPAVINFVVWLLVGLSAVFWGLRLGEARALPQEPAPVVEKPRSVDKAAVVAALGGNAQPAVTASAQRFELRGLIAQSAQAREGVAVVAVDGQPAKPYLVGSRLDDRLVLKSVGPRHAELADTQSGAVVLRLELPDQAPR